MAIYKLRVFSLRSHKILTGTSVSSVPYKKGFIYFDDLYEFGGGRFLVLDIVDVVLQRKEILAMCDR